MAQQAPLLVILLPIVSTLFYQLQSVRGQQIDRNTLLSIRETVTNIKLKEIWSNGQISSYSRGPLIIRSCVNHEGPNHINHKAILP